MDDDRAELGRRDFLQAGFGGLLGLILAQAGLSAPKTRVGNAKACILLWMGGGPSQLDTFDPKPGHANGGPFTGLRTSVRGIHIGQHLPLLAQEMDDLAIIRSLTSREGNHDRATYLVHTGYTPQATVQHPGLGALLSYELARPNLALPSYVCIGGPSIGAGFLGAQYQPFVVSNPGSLPHNLTPYRVDRKRQAKRLDLLTDLEDEFSRNRRGSASAAHRETYSKALDLMASDLTAEFDTSDANRYEQRAYRLETGFGRGCLVARRLVTVGVPFVEVRLGGWDTHSNNFERVAGLCGTLDAPYAALIRDLRASGLLDQTVVVWMGEFGRTPRINGNAGRDHFPRAWSAVLAGGGIRGGQVIGATTADGMEVAQRPVAVPDLFASLAKCFGIDPAKEFTTPEGRPIRVAAKGAKVISELFV